MIGGEGLVLVDRRGDRGVDLTLRAKLLQTETDKLLHMETELRGSSGRRMPCVRCPTPPGARGCRIRIVRRFLPVSGTQVGGLSWLSLAESL